MKRISLLMIIVLSICFPKISFARNLNITDYDTTVSSAMETRVNLSLFKDAYIKADGGMNSISNNSITAAHDYFYDSLLSSGSYGISAAYSGFSYRDYINSPDFATESSRSDFSAFSNYNLYIIPEANIYNGVGVEYDMSLRGVNGSANTEDYRLNALLKLGAGHIIDITPLAEAGVLEDRLLEAGLIKDYLSKEDMLKIAEVIRKYKMGEYGYKNQDTGGGMFLDDISKILEASNMLTRPLGGFGYWRIAESRYVNYNRFKGTVVELSMSSENLVDVSHVGSGTTNREANNYVKLLYATYLPMDWRSQLNVSFDYSSDTEPGDVTPVNILNLSVDYTYDLTNKIWLDLNGLIERNNYSNSDISNNASGKAYGFGINYKIEDYLFISFDYRNQLVDTGDSYEYFAVEQRLYF